MSYYARDWGIYPHSYPIPERFHDDPGRPSLSLNVRPVTVGPEVGHCSQAPQGWPRRPAWGLISISPQADRLLDDALNKLGIDRTKVKRAIRGHTSLLANADQTGTEAPGTGYSHETQELLNRVQRLVRSHGGKLILPIHILHALADIPKEKASAGILNAQVPLGEIKRICGELIAAQTTAESHEDEDHTVLVSIRVASIQAFIDHYSKLSAINQLPGLEDLYASLIAAISVR